MGDVFGSIWWLIVTLGLLISFHEFGHFWVARRCGVKVLTFSIGFGMPLWQRRAKDGTNYVLAAVPLGGYVKMLDEREGEVPADQLQRAFNRRPLGQRTAIIAAGPIANLLFTLAAFWLMFMVGVPEIRALFGNASGLAQQAGVEPGDEIVAVGGIPTRTLTQAGIELLGHAIDREAVTITVENAAGQREDLSLALDRLPENFREDRLFEALGLDIWEPRYPPVVGVVLADRPAAHAGIVSGDRIVRIGDLEVARFRDIGDHIQSLGDGEQAIDFVVLRDGVTHTLTVTPETRDTPAGRKLQVGIAPPAALTEAAQTEATRFYVAYQYGPLASIGEAANETWRIAVNTLGLIGRMVRGDASLRNLSGPISIARYANDSAQMGLARFLFFLGILSLSLAILNFLPIPVLDGGHLLYNLVEWIKGSPVSDRTQLVGQYLGLLAIVGLMSLTFYNDILRLVT